MTSPTLTLASIFLTATVAHSHRTVSTLPGMLSSHNPDTNIFPPRLSESKAKREKDPLGMPLTPKFDYEKNLI